MKKIFLFLIFFYWLLSLLVQKKVANKRTAYTSSPVVLKLQARGSPRKFPLVSSRFPQTPSAGTTMATPQWQNTNTNIFSAKTNQFLPEPQASLLNGILWGEQRAMPKDFYDALRRTGTLHVIALSGMNITILISIIGQVTLFLGRRQSIIISLIVIVIFIGFVGASPSVVRAGIMGTLSLLAIYFGRKSWALLSLLLAAGTMLIINLSWLFNIGFQLSFLATLGIILFGGTARERRVKGVVAEFLFEGKTNLRTTLAAQVFTLPVILYNFKQLSLIAPLTNVLVLWIVQPIMVMGFVLSLLSIIYYPLSIPLSWIIWVPLTYFIEIVELTARIPLAAISF